MPSPKKPVALVTGGSRGIGRAIALLLAERQAGTVIVNYVQNDAEAEKTRQMIEERKAAAVLIKANLLYPAEIDKLFDGVREVTDRLDVFVHCAAITAFKPITAIKPNQWDLTMNINARAFLLCSQKCVPLMKAGKIVAISSLGGRRTLPNYGAMGPTKAALEALVRYLAAELAPMGIRVNGVTGGWVETDSVRQFPEAEQLRQEVVRRTAAGRIGRPEDIARVVLFLISPESEWVVGQTIVADGGLSLQ